ncbi:hypothetical protein I302_100969 [Kwoniella bestiolae CBS 10118]|uniref:SGNH hydrolase-type esterase domain-containing protein n=1 Tax=Kwoniella bestiolae CBS 10118 TaxID=1296100 RepID=A0A1B9G6J6_9TREE|nr:hypothetical protein I302_04346 [Kwoniella bestiolae CBS 10118]OCF26659.1 hypothetical protein I302_04346 [Kwoniella bestiolae CBS 10118]
MARPIQDAILLMGDSITSRQDVPLSLNARLSECYRRTFDILNRGLGAYNTRFYLPLLDQFLLRTSDFPSSSPYRPQQIRLVTIWFGANDAVLPEFLQHIPLEEYTFNLNKILEKLTSMGSPYTVASQDGPLNIVLITPPPLYPDMMGDEDFAGQRDLENTRRYAEAVLDLGKKWKAKESQGGNWRIATVDMFDGILGEAGGKGEKLRPYFTDGLHLSTLGYTVLWKKLWGILETEFKGRGISPSEVEFTVPDWAILDHSDPNSAVDKMKGPYKRV